MLASDAYKISDGNDDDDDYMTVGQIPRTARRGGLLASDMQNDGQEQRALYYRSWMIDFMCTVSNGPDRDSASCPSKLVVQSRGTGAGGGGARVIFCKVIRRQLRNIRRPGDRHVLRTDYLRT